MKTFVLLALISFVIAGLAHGQDKKQLDPKDEVILRLRKTLTESQVELVQLRYQQAMARLRQQYREILAELGEPDADELKQP